MALLPGPPDSIFGVQRTGDMIFMALLGGPGTLGGAVLGASSSSASGVQLGSRPSASFTGHKGGRTMKLVMAAVACVACALIAVPAATAADAVCNTGLQDQLSGPQPSITVPPGGTCVLASAQVDGNVTIARDAELIVFTSDIAGSVAGRRTGVVQIQDSAVHGGVVLSGNGVDDPLFHEVLLRATRIDGGVAVSGVTGQVRLQFDTLGGNLGVLGNQLIEAFAVGLLVDSNTVRGSATISRNRGERKLVIGNQVGNALACFENEPPFDSIANTARRAVGQCASAG